MMKKIATISTIFIFGGLILTSCMVAPAAQPAAPPTASASSGALKIKWLGQSAFVITSSAGIKIINDPYTTNQRMTYTQINEPADVVTVSHEHGDHNNVAAVSGNPTVVRTATEVKGIKFRAIPTFHDNSQGKERGNNTVICFEVDNIKFCHLGDLGHLLNDKQVTDIGKVDILFIPVGGNYTIDAVLAAQNIELLKPNVAIPMHYKTDKFTSPVVGVEEFTKDKKNVTVLDNSEKEFKSGTLPAPVQIIVFQPAP